MADKFVDFVCRIPSVDFNCAAVPEGAPTSLAVVFMTIDMYRPLCSRVRANSQAELGGILICLMDEGGMPHFPPLVRLQFRNLYTGCCAPGSVLISTSHLVTHVYQFTLQ